MALFRAVGRAAQVAVVAFLWGLSVEGAAAQPEEVRVEVDAMGEVLSCIDAEAVEQELAWRAAEEGIRDPIDVRVTAEDASSGRWRLDLELRRGEQLIGTRRIDLAPDECASVPRAIALVVALPLRGGQDAPVEEPPEPPPEEEPEQPIEAPPASEPPSRPEPRRIRDAAVSAKARGWHGRLTVGVGIELGPLPAVAPLVTVGLDLTPTERWIVHLAAEASYPQELRVQEGDVELIHAGLALDACASWPEPSVVTLDTCVRGSLALLSARAGRFTVWNGGSLGALVGAGGTVRAHRTLAGPLHVYLAISAEALLVRPRFVIQHSTGRLDTAHEPAPFALGGELGIGIRLF